MSEFISVDTLAVDSGATTANSIDFKADLTELDTEFADAALIKFEYGTNSDLSASTHNNEDDRALFSLGQIASQITGLNPDTQYYYKAIGETVTYNSATSMDNAVQSGGFMKDLVNNQTAMTKVANSETAMTAIKNNYLINTDNISTLLSSPYIIDTMWSNADAGEKVWQAITPAIPYTKTGVNGDTINVTLEVINNETVYRFVSDPDGDLTSTQEEIISIDLDLSSADFLKFKYVIIQDYGYEFHLEIDGVQVGTSKPAQTSFSEVSFDVSSYNSVSQVKLIGEYGAHKDYDFQMKDLALV